LHQGLISDSVTSVKSSVKIMQLLKENPAMTTSELVEMLGIGKRAVEKNLFNLKSQRKIKRIGPDNGGHWEVLE
jgi:ATP-dependent DNA helicase RecG